MQVRRAAGVYRRGHDAATTGVAEAEGEDDALGVVVPLDDGLPDDDTLDAGVLDDGLSDETPPDDVAPELDDEDGVVEQPTSSTEPTSTAAAARPRTVTTSRG